MKFAQSGFPLFPRLIPRQEILAVFISGAIRLAQKDDGLGFSLNRAKAEEPPSQI
jgi:hypothetical protein